MGCAAALSERIILAQDSIEWVYEYPHPSNPGIFLSSGQHYVFGHFRLIYFNPFTYIISNTDTIDFFVKQGLSAVIDETNQYIYLLEQNYPNPFNPTTTLEYYLPGLSKVNLTVYDVLGSEISHLVNEEQKQGNYKIEFNGNELPSGVYFYHLQANDYIQTMKMLLLK